MNFSDILKRPIVVALIALILGIVLGLGWGWGLQPVEWVDAPVYLLRPDLQDEYLRMTIDSLRVNGDEELAVKRFNDLGANGYSLFQNVKANPGKLDPNFVDQFRDMLKRRNLYDAPTETPTTGGTAPSAVGMAIILGGLLAVAGVVLARVVSGRFADEALIQLAVYFLGIILALAGLAVVITGIRKQ